MALAFQERFEKSLPDELNLGHRSLNVAESMDASIERIVRFLSDMSVPINMATIQHFKDKTGRSILAQVYLIEPEEAAAKSQPMSRRSKRYTLSGVQTLTDKNGIGELYTRIRKGLRGISDAQPYSRRVFYQLKRDDGSRRTVLIVHATPYEKSGGLRFTVHATRLKDNWGIGLEDLRTWLPSTSDEEDVSGWIASAEDERRDARGLSGFFQSIDEVDKFVDSLRSAIAQSRIT